MDLMKTQQRRYVTSTRRRVSTSAVFGKEESVPPAAQGGSMKARPCVVVRALALPAPDGSRGVCKTNDIAKPFLFDPKSRTPDWPAPPSWQSGSLPPKSRFSRGHGEILLISSLDPLALCVLRGLQGLESCLRAIEFSNLRAIGEACRYTAQDRIGYWDSFFY